MPAVPAVPAVPALPDVPARPVVSPEAWDMPPSTLADAALAGPCVPAEPPKVLPCGASDASWLQAPPASEAFEAAVPAMAAVGGAEVAVVGGLKEWRM